MFWVAGLLALGLALVHLLSPRLTFLGAVPRSAWLSGAGGVAVAYVFLHVLPELAEHRETFADAFGMAGRDAEALVYSVSMAGLAVFYGLERAAKRSRERSRGRGGEDRVETHVFAVHAGSFALYNLLIGYLLLHREEEGLRSLLFFAVAMGLHFLSSDYGLTQHHKDLYDRVGRWLFSAALAAGFALGAVTEVSEATVGLLFAFLAGGVVLNVMKEELPEERRSRFLPFALGAAGYAALLILT